MATTAGLTSLPFEIIELIALNVATLIPFRPPTDLLNFLLTNKKIYQLLRPSKNDQLYANIFRILFDLEALERRFQCDSFPPSSPTLDPDSDSASSQSKSLGPLLEPDLHQSNTSSCASDPDHQPVVLSKETGPAANLPNRPASNHEKDKSPCDRQAMTNSNDDNKGHPDHDHRHRDSYSTGEDDEMDDCHYCKPCHCSSELSNCVLASSYFERLALFKRMRQFAVHQSPPSLSHTQRSTDLEPYNRKKLIPQLDNQSMSLISRDLWLIYLMVFENDGRNWNQLIQAANVTGFLLNYFHYEINPSATAPGYPIERPEIAIALKLCHLFLDLQDSELARDYWTSESGIETRLFALKPYTLAAHQYDIAYAPWSIRELPINTSSQQVLRAISRKLTAREKQTLTPIDWYPSSDNQRNPLIHEDPIVDQSTRDPTLPPDTDNSRASTPGAATISPPRYRYSELNYMGKLLSILPPLHSHVALLSFFWCNIKHAEPSGQPRENEEKIDFFLRKIKNSTNLSSIEYDREFERLTRCLDPFECRGLPFDFYQNCLEGGWDGQFGFFDLLSYRQMLSGSLQSVYSGRYGDQNQVLKLSEFVVRVSDGQAVKFVDGTRAKVLTSDMNRNQDEEGVKEDGEVVEEPLESETQHLSEMKYLLDPSPAEPILVDYNPSERYELQIHGDGHSAWGHFIIKGRVRAWDGMLTFLKIYDAGRHGRWLYRGYHAPGNMLVGRWRDGITAEWMDGYEGTFVMFRRN